MYNYSHYANRRTPTAANTTQYSYDEDKLSHEKLLEYYCLNNNIPSKYLYSFGHNSKGQLGLGTITEKKLIFNTPFPVINPNQSGNLNKNVKIVSCGGYFVIIVTQDNMIYACGENSYGQLGISPDFTKYTSTLTPINLQFKDTDQDEDLLHSTKPYNIKLVKCGKAFTFLLIEEKGSNNEDHVEEKLFVFGRNADGQLGVEGSPNVFPPKQVTKFIGKRIKFIGCGFGHAIIVTTDNKIYGCGDNRFGQCGVNVTTNNNRANNNIKEFTEITNLNVDKEVSKITAVECGYYHTVIVYDDEKVYAFGMNRDGQFGNKLTKEQHSCILIFHLPGQKLLKVKSVARYTVIITRRGEIYVAGTSFFTTGYYSQNVGNDEFVRVTDIEDFVMKSTGENLSKVTNIACGESHMLFSVGTKRLFIHGDNTYGQLGKKIVGNSMIEELDLVTLGIVGGLSKIKELACGDHFSFISIDHISYPLLYKTLEREDHPLTDISFVII
ncbi:hypothetical protein ABK040_002341 [Willaertia magna]